MCQDSCVSCFFVWLSELVDIESIDLKIQSVSPGRLSVLLPVWKDCPSVMRKVYMHSLVWITLTVDQLMYWWKETWRLCRGWVTWIGLHPSSGLLCFFSSKIPGCWICGCWLLSDSFPGLYPCHCFIECCTHWLIFLAAWSVTWLSNMVDKQHDYQPTGERNESIVEAWRDAVDITTGWVRAPEVE